MPQQKYRVNDEAPNGLYIRFEPLEKGDSANKESTKRGLLPMGHLVTKKADSSVVGWWGVSTVPDGAPLDGHRRTEQHATPGAEAAR